MKRKTITALLAGAVLSVSGITAASAHTIARDPGAAAAPTKAVSPRSVWSAFTSMRIENRLSGKCLTVLGSGNGLAVSQLSCGAAGAQQHWTFSGGVLHNDETGNVLDLYAGIGTDGESVAAWGFHAYPQQYWSTVDKGGVYFELHNSATNNCLDLSGNSYADGATIQEWGCNWGANNNQQWFVTY